MLDFVINIRDLRRNLIGAIVSDGKVEFSRMTKDQRAEFQDHRPRSTTATKAADTAAVTRQQAEKDRRAIEKCAEFEGFPEVYKSAARRDFLHLDSPG
jgi:replication initiation and membrane attachment protein DnaB